jgi:sulfatase modifying factor 1
MWPDADRWRAPVGDFPPPWASAWGDDRFGLWADLVINGVTQRMRWIEPSGPEGFLMGASQAERDAITAEDVRKYANETEHEPRRVLVQQGFWLADTPCTQAFWLAVMGDNPSRFKDVAQAAMCPVEQVGWDDVDGFLGRLKAQAAWGIGDRAMLPTEVQWEYAARAGMPTAYWWGDTLDPNMANTGHDRSKNLNVQKGTTPVKRHSANPWGLFDVHGNVWEWCVDPWQSRLDQPEAEPDDSARVVRGGSWILHPADARSASRSGRLREFRSRNLGFRLALRSSSAAPGGLAAR